MQLIMHTRAVLSLPPTPAGVVAEGRLLLLVANKLDALAPHEQERALELVADTARRALPDVR